MLRDRFNDIVNSTLSNEEKVAKLLPLFGITVDQMRIYERMTAGDNKPFLELDELVDDMMDMLDELRQ